jgi:hypothetical protein
MFLLNLFLEPLRNLKTVKKNSIMILIISNILYCILSIIYNWDMGTVIIIYSFENFLILAGYIIRCLISNNPVKEEAIFSNKFSNQKTNYTPSEIFEHKKGLLVNFIFLTITNFSAMFIFLIFIGKNLDFWYYLELLWPIGLITIFSASTFFYFNKKQKNTIKETSFLALIKIIVMFLFFIFLPMMIAAFSKEALEIFINLFNSQGIIKIFFYMINIYLIIANTYYFEKINKKVKKQPIF